MIEIREYIDTQGRSAYARWFDGLQSPARRPRWQQPWSGWSKATSPTPRASVPVSPSTAWISAPVTRAYFGKDGDTLIILLGGGTKKRQRKDIEAAQDLWREYKQIRGQIRGQQIWGQQIWGQQIWGQQIRGQACIVALFDRVMPPGKSYSQRLMQ